MAYRPTARHWMLVAALVAAAAIGFRAAPPQRPPQGEATQCAPIGAVEIPPSLADLRGTVTRIEAGEAHPHPQDGGTFFNRERLLPPKPAGYYREYVHPTPGVRGPGLRRLVRGCAGDLYFSPDHYRSFTRLN